MVNGLFHNVLVFLVFFSDHIPLVFVFGDNAVSGSRAFRFRPMWTSHKDFRDLVIKVWNSNVFYGCSQFNLSQKLKLLKAELKRWIKETFGDVSKMAEASKEKLGKIQEKISVEGFSELVHQEELSIQEELNVALKS